MTSIVCAKSEWEAATVPHSCPRTRCNGEIVEDPFRKYGDAVAWLEWSDVCEIKKIETLRPRSGAATALVTFLKALADKYKLRLFGQPIPYAPDCSLAADSPLSEEELFAWYSKRGFVVGRTSSGVPYLWYPDVPEA